MILKIKNIKTGRASKGVPIEDVIYRQDEIEFEFGNQDEDDFETVTYGDFLYFGEDFEVLLEENGKIIEKILSEQ